MPVDTRSAIDHPPSKGDEEEDSAIDGAVQGSEKDLGPIYIYPETDVASTGIVGRTALFRRLVGGALPFLAMALAVGAGLLAWQAGSARAAERAVETSVQAATDSTVAMLAYNPDSVETDLTAAADNLTGEFRDEYTKLINEVVIPGSKEKHISSVVTVPGAASVSATGMRAEVLIFVNQTILVGDDAPTFTASTVRVTLERINKRWLISHFEPI